MRPIRSLLALITLAASPVAAQNGDVIAGFAPGLYAANPIGSGGVAHQECLPKAGALVTGGRPAGACSFKTISTQGPQTVITWRCEGGVSGRTSVRRDSAGVYTVHLQGVGGGLPFAEHAEWRRLGDC